MKDKLIELHKSLSQFLRMENCSESHKVTVMTPDQFMEYAGVQLEIAKSESEDAAISRIAHLAKNVALLIEKNAFDSAGVVMPLYTGELSRQATTAMSEQMADHTNKPGKMLSVEASNTEANPKSNAFGRGGPNIGEGSYSLHGKVTKSAFEWPRDLNADDADKDPSLQF